MMARPYDILSFLLREGGTDETEGFVFFMTWGEIMDLMVGLEKGRNGGRKEGRKEVRLCLILYLGVEGVVVYIIDVVLVYR